jgi:hypothetical protein
MAIGAIMSKSKRIDINKIIKKNPAVDMEELQRNIKMLQELKQAGISIGPNYNLGSPYERPEPQIKPQSPAIRLRNILP